MSEPSRVDKAMRRLAESQTERNRFAVYSALLSSRLVVPLVPGTLQPGDGPFQGVPTPSQLATDNARDGAHVVFTDDFGLPRWREGGGPRARLDGVLLFPLLAELGCKALLINPKGRVGGMLYGHEVSSIAEAALRRMPPS